MKNETGLRAGSQPNDRREFGECTSEQRRIIDAGIAEGMEDFRKGRSHGPFTADEAVTFLKSQMKRPHTKSVKPANARCKSGSKVAVSQTRRHAHT